MRWEQSDMEKENSLIRLIPQSTPLRLVLATGEDIPNQTLPAVQALGRRGQTVVLLVTRAGRVETKTCLDKGETSADPVAIAAVNQLVGASREPTLGCVLPI